jgi:hypothetical protein
MPTPRTPARLALAVALTLAGGTLHAQTDPGMSGRGQTVRIERDSAYGRVVSVVREAPFSYVRIETREPGAALNQHPVQIDPAALRAMLARVQLAGTRSEPLFNSGELDELVPPLAQALARATPEQDVSFAVAGQHGLMGPLALRVVTTARVFWTGNTMNLVFGLVRRDVEAQFRATGYQVALEPGKRAEAVDRKVQLTAATGATSRRADWLVLDPSAAAPAPAAAAPAPLPAPALVVPAPSTPAAASAAPAPAPATPAATPATPASTATAPPAPATSAPRAPAAPAAGSDADAIYRNVSERLKALQKLRDSGAITEQEYQDKRREILKAL